MSSKEANKDLAVKEMVTVLGGHYKRTIQHQMLITMKYELGVDDALEAMRDAQKQWAKSSFSLELMLPPELEDRCGPATEFDLKRLDRDGHLLTIYITAMKNGGPCSWTLESPEEWYSDELIEVLENIALHYKHNPDSAPEDSRSTF